MKDFNYYSHTGDVWLVRMKKNKRLYQSDAASYNSYLYPLYFNSLMRILRNFTGEP